MILEKPASFSSAGSGTANAAHSQSGSSRRANAENTATKQSTLEERMGRNLAVGTSSNGAHVASSDSPKVRIAEIKKVPVRHCLVLVHMCSAEMKVPVKHCVVLFVCVQLWCSDGFRFCMIVCMGYKALQRLVRISDT